LSDPQAKEFRDLSGYVLRVCAVPFEAFAELGDAPDPRAALRGLAARSLVREAIALAAPDLAGELERWLAGHDDPAVERAVLRYVSRMAGHPRPFGRFAGVAVGRWGEDTRLEPATAEHHRAHRGIDPAFFARPPTERATTRYFHNSSLYRAGERWRYVEIVDTTYAAVSLDASPLLDAVISRAATGATRAELEAAVATDDAAAFVAEVIAAQIVVPDDAPTVTGPEPPQSAAAADLHIAMTHATLDARVRADVHATFALLREITPPPAPGPWSAFCADFVARYERREVPLVEALDPDVGVGFGEGPTAPLPLLAALPRAGAIAPPPSWTARDAYLIGLYRGAIARGATTIDLADADLVALRTGAPPPPPDSAMAHVALCATGELFVREIGASATSNLARFCHGSPEIRALVDEIVTAEEALEPEAVHAEIVHLPRSGLTIVVRPALRAYEIPYLGASGLDRAHQLPVSDLLVSIVDGWVRLRSMRLGREVRPRHGTAHASPRSELPIYRFLCAHAIQRQRALRWSWSILDGEPFLPRVTRGRVILARARWRVSRDELGAGDRAAIAALRARRDLPRWLMFDDISTDRELPIDLDNPLSVESFAALARGREGIALHEVLPAPAVRNASGAFVHDLAIPLVRAAPPAAPVVWPRGGGARRFAPGSSWLYAKLYGGPGTADAVLRDVVAPLAGGTWFFLRYADPEPHLRVRWHGDPVRLAGELLPRLHELAAPALASGVLWRLQLDTYEREVERCGGPVGVELAERLFAADSGAALAMVCSTLDGGTGADHRWRLALRAIDQLLGDFAMPLAERLAFVTRLRDWSGGQHGLTTALQRRLGALYRAHAGELAALLATEATLDDDDLLAPLVVRSQRNAPLLAEHDAAIAAGAIARTRRDLAGHLIHMHVNRMLPAEQPRHELVIYDLLRRLYAARIARG
jgi:lantibiotic biosynthesis protein